MEYVKNDSYGNARCACHFLSLLNTADEIWIEKTGWSVNRKYSLAINIASNIGGRKFHNKSFGGGIVFYTVIEEASKRVLESLSKCRVYESPERVGKVWKITVWEPSGNHSDVHARTRGELLQEIKDRDYIRLF